MTGHKQSTEGYLFGICGLIVHLVILWGVLDANFYSPVLNDLPVVEPLSGAPAKRLFLFVADGMRYRTFSSEPAPFLKNIIKTQGTWGVSHTRMPTESRPGNVAIAAGLYEDPSALFKGWKENPVDFDSVFNQRSHLNVRGDSYPAEWQDFDKASNSPITLDSWVFKKYFEWLDRDAIKIKSRKGVLLFFHLLGCDTAGHASKPHSKYTMLCFGFREYKESLKFVDQKIKEVVKSVDKFFGDSRTAYIFTADHGMTDWGSHGSGSDDETETPFIAWGAGVSHLSGRRDIEQADIAPLVASLLGISIPVNSEGVLPRLYLQSGNQEYGARALLNNIKQLLNQVKGNRLTASGEGSSYSNWRERELEKMIDKVEKLLHDNKVVEAIRVAEETIEKCKSYLYYYRQYQKNQLIVYLTLMWLGWIVLLVLKITGTPRSHLNNTYKVKSRKDSRVIYYGIAALIFVWLGFCAPLVLVPVYHVKKNEPIRIIIGGTVLFLAMVITAIMQKLTIKKPDKLLILTALALAIYPALPTVKPDPQTGIVLISVAVAAVALVIHNLPSHILIIELLRLALTTLILTGDIDGRTGLSWIILASSPISIFLHPADDVKKRLTGVTYGLFCPLVLLSASYEPQVYLLLAIHLMTLLDNDNNDEELKSTGHCRRSLSPSDLMLYILLSFFGTGNMASISSFDPMWTKHFITLFSPFTMSALILLKLAIPLILVGCASRVLASSSIFLAVLLLGDCLSLPLIFTVTPQGSWLDIGTAISRYAIAVTLPCLFLVLYHLSSPLMTVDFSSRKTLKKHLV
ncbi:Similar to PIGN: GPI ethanolamine phosphate transferase 1 (Homo sapiens) [Cotesia congregata]|uniref:GPI ethanolamine phosphate transferase 1 n=1 Tax=Cotesia congregata TaxID=51543 RepID=A0A8J2HL41_COTCN|nr:Similar to PIGN: GPI ethanolamine phosphate transferase 1 (Homo sapiens) [Cotesia congregata]